MSFARFILPTLILAGSPGLALAQIDSREGIALQNQILELRQEVQQLQSQGGGGIAPAPQAAPVPSGPAPSGDVAADLVVRVSALEEQVRSLQGRVDELANALKQQNDDLSKQISDLAFKLGQGGAAPASSAQAPGAPVLQPAEPGISPDSADSNGELPPQPAPATRPQAQPRRTPELVLKQGSAAMARRDYAGAEAAAREVIATGHGPRVGDAELLLARAQFGQHQYQASAAQYYQVYARSPRSPRAAESLLGVSHSLLALNDTKDACEALAKLQVEFPKPDPGIRAGAAAARKRAKCSR